MDELPSLTLARALTDHFCVAVQHISGLDDNAIFTGCMLFFADIMAHHCLHEELPPETSALFIEQTMAVLTDACHEAFRSRRST